LQPASGSLAGGRHPTSLLKEDAQMTYDFSPLFRTAIGFDHMAQLLDSALSGGEQNGGYPPYNIESTGENAYRITMAVAGFSADDLSIVAQDNALVVSGKVKAQENGARYLHRGIAGRAFERRFQLADFIKVAGAALENGLLHVDLVREVPEAMKPRQVRIESKTANTALDAKAA
jgi:molecular chaperone IbpA